MKRCHGRLHYDRKFQIFIFLTVHNNVNKGAFCLIISYLQIKSYNVLNYNNCSTDCIGTDPNTGVYGICCDIIYI